MMPRLDQETSEGRADVVVAKALRHAILSLEDYPLVQMLYKAARPEIHRGISQLVGPRAKSAKSLRTKIKEAAAIQQEITRRLAEEL